MGSSGLYLVRGLLTASSVTRWTCHLSCSPSGPQNRRGELHRCSQVPVSSDKPEIGVCPTLLRLVAVSVAVWFLKATGLSLAWQGNDLFRRKYSPAVYAHSSCPLICPVPRLIKKKKTSFYPACHFFCFLSPTQLRIVWVLEPRKAATNCGANFLPPSMSHHLAIKGFLSDRLKDLRHL